MKYRHINTYWLPSFKQSKLFLLYNKHVLSYVGLRWAGPSCLVILSLYCPSRPGLIPCQSGSVLPLPGRPCPVPSRRLLAEHIYFRKIVLPEKSSPLIKFSSRGIKTHRQARVTVCGSDQVVIPGSPVWKLSPGGICFITYN